MATTMKKVTITALAMAGILSFVACKGKGMETAKITIQNPWVLEVPETQTSSAAFMTIQNPGTEGDALVSASSDVAGVVELHEMATENETMKMRKIEKIDVPAGQNVELKQGGLHVMLIDLKKHPKEGEIVKITLNFEKAGKLEIEAPVKKGEAMMGGDESMMQKGEAMVKKSETMMKQGESLMKKGEKMVK